MKTSKFDYQTLFILIFGLFAVFAPVVIKTHSISYLISPVALLIVLGGTFCAGCVSFSLAKIIKACASLKNLLIERDRTDFLNTTEEIINLSKIARARGVESLFKISNQISNPYLKSGVESILENADTKTIEENLRFLSFCNNKQDFENIEIFEELGGYAPTFGMLGALVGLIQVSVTSSDPKILLTGIAGAFIATLYGVASANLVFLPIAKKMKNKLDEKLLEEEIIINSVIDIAQEQSSIIISEKIDKMLLKNGYSKKGKIHYFVA